MPAKDVYCLARFPERFTGQDKHADSTSTQWRRYRANSPHHQNDRGPASIAAEFSLNNSAPFQNGAAQCLNLDPPYLRCTAWRDTPIAPAISDHVTPCILARRTATASRRPISLFNSTFARSTCNGSSPSKGPPNAVICISAFIPFACQQLLTPSV